LREGYLQDSIINECSLQALKWKLPPWIQSFEGWNNVFFFYLSLVTCFRTVIFTDNMIILAWILPETDTKIRIWMQVVYLDGNLRKYL
jgi:hypothetical protein